ncbi:s-methyl-5-thioribose-1-phosphate isomerase [Kibdelosporangium phytohabitans]|uniref:Methylthioribose-1-phosphate isomerase n=1 Tax=Kibdelosporangium phytohabitans TaxID=860235 RepID=A0A0N9IBC7_9PSEU|nr:s-methyl-5-thioribose-1-phosphate isomerase [Kibdelosporangium phytohabitans]ALG13485.1 methylthioribose-1-phosphate isomerase [Kibdelosporangium phytohabitans]MBE1465334.1 methylthioribose-1-phosphate isomerase [Kibdelosporangium phytohabitans]
MTPVLADSVKLTDDGVLILDRRRFPFAREWVLCRNSSEVAKAIEDMVTQSSGPYFAALYGMVLAAREAAGLRPHAAYAYMEQAGVRLTNARRTNNHLRKAVHAVLSSVSGSGETLLSSALAGAQAGDDLYRGRSAALGRAAASLLPDEGGVMTHCWADLYLVDLVAAAQRDGKRLRFFCTETRPYLQGARLTAETLAEMGVDTTLISDGMGAAVLQSGEVDALVTAADRVTMTGDVINKVGTLGLAVAAAAFGVPFHAMVQAPDQDARTADDVPIEYRPGEEVLHTLGIRTASEKVRGLYPAFDVTPPRFVTTIVTDRGPFEPHRIAEYYSEGEQNQ